MQDENTTQPASDSVADSSLPEPSLSLSTNPSDAQASYADTTEPSATPEPQTVETPAEVPAPLASDEAAAVTTPVPGAASGELETIKSSVLEELAPIVNELDQEPEERYRTLMMVIQASDNQELVKDAYEAAQKIEDKKAKAEALLNILNEINYFTGKGEKSES